MVLHLLLLSFGYLYEVGNLFDFTFGSCIIWLDNFITDFSQSKGLSGSDLIVFTTLEAPNQFNFQVCHGSFLP